MSCYVFGPRCPLCGSNRVTVLADIEWREDKQCWEAVTIYENDAFCHACESEIDAEYKETHAIATTPLSTH